MATASAQPAAPLAEAAWLQGCWVVRDEARLIEEIWMVPRSDFMIGMAQVTGRRGAEYEFLVLHQKDGTLTYTAQPSGQAPVDFRATHVSGHLLRFENPAHDHRITDNSTSARVFAQIGSAVPAFALLFGRTPCGFP